MVSEASRTAGWRPMTNPGRIELVQCLPLGMLHDIDLCELERPAFPDLGHDILSIITEPAIRAREECEANCPLASMVDGEESNCRSHLCMGIVVEMILFPISRCLRVESAKTHSG